MHKCHAWNADTRVWHMGGYIAGMASMNYAVRECNTRSSRVILLMSIVFIRAPLYVTCAPNNLIERIGDSSQNV